MISKRDVQLGKIALRLGMVSKDQINGCLALKKKLAETKGKKVALGALLLKKGYLTEEQLEEIVRLHNEEKGGEEEDGERKSRRSKRVDANGKSTRAPRVEETEERRSRRSRPAKDEEGGPAEEEEKPRREKLKQSREGKSERDNKASREEAAPRKKGDKPDRERPDKEKADKPGSGKRPSAVKELSTSQSEVDSAVFQSAPDGAIDEEDRRIVACSECGKKYRIRKKQVGKRFACRRCKAKVKVPKDLFDRPLSAAEAADSGASGSGVQVEEFSLGSGDQTEPDEGATPSQRVGAAAATAAAAVKKVQSQASIRDLAKAATKAQPRPLGPRRRFGVKQAATLGVCVLGLAGIVLGWTGYKSHLEAKARAARQAELEVQLKEWDQKLVRATEQIEAAIKDPLNGATGLRTLLAQLDTVSGEVIGLAIENQPLAQARVQELDPKALRRRAHLAEAEGYLQMGGVHVEEALVALSAAADLDPSHEPTQLQVAQRLIAARRPKEAIARLKTVTSQEGLALLGLAYERGDDPAKAAETYARLTDPLGPVLAARAWLLEGGQGARALEALDKASGLDGQDLAAMRVVEARAKELKGDLSGAERAFDQAAEAGADSPFPRIAKGEFLLRHGRAEEALQTIRAGNGVASSARGYLALGDALAATLDLETARRTWRDSVAQALLPEKARVVAGVIDPFLPPISDDPRSESRCRLAALLAAAGDVGGAQNEYGEALKIDPFSVRANAGLAHLDLLQEAVSGFTDARVAQALRLCGRAGGVEGELLRYPTAARVLVVRGAQLVLAGKPQEALDVLSQALQIDRAVAPQVDTLRVRAYVQMGQETRAMDASQAAARQEVEGDAAGARVFVAARDAFAAASPEDETALKKVEQGVLLALAQNPYHGQALVLRARLRIATRKTKEALADLERAEKVNPFLRDVFVTRGFLYVRDLPPGETNQGTTNKAKNDFDAAQNLEEKLKLGVRAETQLGRAMVQYKLSNYREALLALEACLKADPNYAEAYKLRATIRSHLGQPGAKEDEQKARELAARAGQGK